ncbi:hypothetical protein ACHHYP_20585 [Achlya hypogyna]|uniref:Uncharacterized protein n=1 Tax=Achlya hypogyna TaxID=1202772 RepID=A0A1V9YI34_ACHHY|nr:hypothetical protein ACHHYP_20585 [Achlya hypogyna]
MPALRTFLDAGLFGSSSLIQDILYLLFAAIGIIVIAILYLLWTMWREGLQDENNAAYQPLHDDDGNPIAPPADTICSRGAGIRCDNAETRPKLRSLRVNVKEGVTRQASAAELATSPHSAMDSLRHTMSLPDIFSPKS